MRTHWVPVIGRIHRVIATRISHETFTTAEHVADIVVVHEVIRIWSEVSTHLHGFGADDTTADGDFGETRFLVAQLDVVDLKRWRIANDALLPGEITHVGHLAAAEHRTVDDGP